MGGVSASALRTRPLLFALLTATFARVTITPERVSTDFVTFVISNVPLLLTPDDGVQSRCVTPPLRVLVQMVSRAGAGGAPLPMRA